MTIIWLIVWLVHGTPHVEWFSSDWNNWGISLAICLAIDIFGGGGYSTSRD
jgi:hypothetical protein